MLSIDDVDNIDENKLSTEKQFERIAWMESKIIEKEGNDRLLTDSFHQTLRLTMYVRDFYITNKDLVLTFMRGKHAYPSLIMHKMVWTIGNDSSYPGVLYSRHSRTGLGRQIESFPDIFGEEIMTGNITAVDIEYFDRVVIREQYPAVYHFDPLLINLEKRFKSPVTIEFGVETIPGRASLFAVLQLNRSELTGRAALLSSIEMYTGEKISNITWKKYKNDEYNKQHNPTVTQPKPVVQPQPVEEKTVTQDMEETPSIEKPTPEKTAEKPVEEQEEQEKPVEKPTPEVNQRALFKAPTSDQPSSSEGITGNEGDQGTPEGLENIQKYEGQGGSGGGPSFSLGNRGAKHLPTPHIDFREEGVVVVDIIVDKKGIVKNVSIGKGTTTTNATLRETALKAALNAVFTEDPNAPDEQKGTITYTFIIRQ